MMLWFWSEYPKHMVGQDLTFSKLYHKITEGFYYLGLTINISIKINNGHLLIRGRYVCSSCSRVFNAG